MLTFFSVLMACEGDATKGEAGPLTLAEPTCEGEADAVALERTPTWADVAPILGVSCAGCHTEGSIGPFALDSYEAAAPMAAAIAASTAARTMPPWQPAPCASCQTFLHDLSLTDVELATLAAWADAGAPRGEVDARVTPTPLPTLDHVNAVVAGPEPYTPPDTRDDTYRCIVMDAPSATTAFLTGYEVIPDNAAILHHVVLSAVSSDAQEAELDALDAADPGPGFDCFSASVDDLTPLFAWAPGQGAVTFPEGTGLTLGGGRRLLAQMHYNTRGGSGPDQSAVALQLSDRVDTPAVMTMLSNRDLVLPPGEDAIVASQSLTLPAEADGLRLWGVMAHMHATGASYALRATGSAGDTCLMDIPSWDYAWQGFYLYEEPVTLRGGDTVTMDCTYDTRGRTTVTTYGEGTDDEMCMAFVYMTR